MATTAVSTANPYMARQAGTTKLATTYAPAIGVSQLRKKITMLQQDLQAYGSRPSTSHKVYEQSGEVAATGLYLLYIAQSSASAITIYSERDSCLCKVHWHHISKERLHRRVRSPSSMTRTPIYLDGTALIRMRRAVDRNLAIRAEDLHLKSLQFLVAEAFRTHNISAAVIACRGSSPQTQY